MKNNILLFNGMSLWHYEKRVKKDICNYVLEKSNINLEEILEKFYINILQIQADKITLPKPLQFEKQYIASVPFKGNKEFFYSFIWDQGPAGNLYRTKLKVAEITENYLHFAYNVKDQESANALFKEDLKHLLFFVNILNLRIHSANHNITDFINDLFYLRQEDKLYEKDAEEIVSSLSQKEENKDSYNTNDEGSMAADFSLYSKVENALKKVSVYFLEDLFKDKNLLTNLRHAKNNNSCILVDKKILEKFNRIYEDLEEWDTW